MLNRSLVFALLAVGALISACQKSPDAEYFPPTKGDPEKPHPDWPAYSEQSLSGTVNGQGWIATSAIARPNKNNAAEMIIDIYSEPISGACEAQPFPKRPYASVIIPAQYSKTEYSADMANMGPGTTGNPLTFISLAGASKNILAEKTKLQISEITTSGFQMSLFARGKDVDGSISEINGKTFVSDCLRTVDFKAWENLIGWYNLKSFDGVAQDGRTSIIEIDNILIYDYTTQKYLPMVVFPLYRSISSGSDLSTKLGPIKGLGQTTLTKNASGAIMTYNYSGPIKYKGLDVNLNLDMVVKKVDSTLFIQFTLEIPSYITKTSHSFTLQKY